MTKTISLGLALTLITGTAGATESAYRKIVSLSVFTDGGTMVVLDGSIPTVKCTEKKAFRVVNEAMTRQVLASFLAKREIKVNTSETCTKTLDDVVSVTTR